MAQAVRFDRQPEPERPGTIYDVKGPGEDMPTIAELRDERHRLDGDLIRERSDSDESAADRPIDASDMTDIFNRYQTPLTNFIFRLVGNLEQAQDLAQDTMVKAHKALSGGTTIQPEALSSWMYRIASNTATDALRRRRLIAWLPLSLFNDDRGVGAGVHPGMRGPTTDGALGEAALHAATVMSGYDGGEFEARVADRDLLSGVLKQMPPKYLTCLALYEHEGFSCAEIAEILNVSPSAVKMRLMRARERFETLYKIAQAQDSDRAATSDDVRGLSGDEETPRERFAVPLRDGVVPRPRSTRFPTHIIRTR